jgi:S-methylmethionine-dependent homocysteine/selenocysteine methylase
MNIDPPVFPSQNGAVFLTDGGLETTLVFHEGLDLPCFAAFPLLLSGSGRQQLERYFEPYLRTARERRVGFILDTPTWRANTDWGAKLGYSLHDIADINRQAVTWAKDLRRRHVEDGAGVVINGVVGPRGDGYQPGWQMTADEAEDYHAPQIAAFCEADVDLVSAITMNYTEEAVGVANAARALRVPVVISFTVETDGRLASGENLRSAIERTDEATSGTPVYYMINCAHPTHFEHVFSDDAAWTSRIRGLRANASQRSHAELDEAVELDSGDPMDLGRHYRELRGRIRNLSVLGGCCGTDHRHIVAICDACLPAR